MSQQITEAIMGAWDEDEAPVQESPEVAEPVETIVEDVDQDEVIAGDEVDEDEETTADEEGEVLVQPEPDEEVEVEEPSEEEEPEAPSGDEQEQPVASVSDDPEIQAYLARHGGTVESALKAAASQFSLLGRQGRELGELRSRVTELEGEVEQATAFAQAGAQYLDEGQRAWLEEATSSENPVGYIQAAVQSGEYDLARAVLEAGEFTSYQAIRLSQAIDSAEGRSIQGTEEAPQPLDHQALFGVLQQFYPDMPSFEAEMVSTIAAMGPNHPLAVQARSADPVEAGNALIAVYEIARAKTATVSQTREDVKTKQRSASDAVRRAGQVSSSRATNAQAQKPRSQQLMPGLTLEALEAEFDTE